MEKETFDLAKQLDEDLKPVKYGDSVIYPPLAVGGRVFHFDAAQIRFLYALQKTQGDVEKSCAMAGTSDEWARKFLSTRKFKEYRNMKLAVSAVRSGELIDWWWQMGLDGAKGMIEWYEGPCALCHEVNRFTLNEAEMFRQDDMSFKASCRICMQPVEIAKQESPFRVSREQVQFWSELGNRLVPKVERIHHQFSNEKITFVESEDAA